MRTTWRRLIKKVNSFFYAISVENLKSTPYDTLPAPLDWSKITKGRELCVEIGSGHGEVLLGNDSKSSIMIGYEIKSRFFRLTQRKIRRRSDIFVFKGSGYESLSLHYRDSTLSRIYILFPDPWHKKKHAKRRPITAQFFSQVAQKLKNHGEIVIATDWVEYAEFVRAEAGKVTTLYEVQVKEYKPEEFSLPVTHYHQKWARKGRSFTAIILKKIPKS